MPTGENNLRGTEERVQRSVYPVEHRMILGEKKGGRNPVQKNKRVKAWCESGAMGVASHGQRKADLRIIKN